MGCLCGCLCGHGCRYHHLPIYRHRKWVIANRLILTKMRLTVSLWCVSVSVAELIGGGSGTSRATLFSFVIGSWKKIIPIDLAFRVNVQCL